MRPRLSSLLFGLLFLSVLQVYSQDPTFEWVARAGSAATFSGGYGISNDAAGNVYVAGRFNGTIDFDPGAGVANLTSAGGLDIFVTKTDAAGNLVWARRMGGTLDDYSFDVFVDEAGNVYATGAFVGTADFDPGAGTFNLSSAGLFEDIFVLKLDVDGNFAWARKMGSADFDFGRSITVSPAGNVFTTGSFRGTVDFDPGAGTSFLTSASGNDIFISKLDASGNFVWARRMGGTSNDIGYAIAVDAAENVFTTGSFNSTADFDPGPSAFNLVAAGSGDIFVSKLNPSGDFVWATRMGGTSSDVGYGIQVDFAGNVYTTGYFESTADFDPGAGTANLVSLGFNDSFVSKLDAAGNYLWAKGMGGTSDEQSNGLALDDFGNVYTTGSIESTVDFDPGPGTFNITPVGASDGYVHKLNASGDFVWVQALLGTGSAWPNGISVDHFGSVCTTGYFNGTVDFDPGAAVFNATAVGSNDKYIHTMSQELPPPTLSGFAPKSGPVGTTVILTGTNFIPSISFNTVYFGATRAVVTSATPNQLTVTVPSGAAHDRISVTRNGLGAISNDLFVMNSGCNQTIGATSFAPKVDFAAGVDPYAMAQGDFDLDGKIDMVSANYGSETVSLFRNTSTGPGNIAFAPKQDITFLDAGRPYAIATGDYDGDGKLDFAVAAEFTHEVSVFRNTSSGPGDISFAAKIDFPSGAFPHGITAADFNNDGRIDVAATSNNLDVVSVFINTSTGPGNISFAARVDFAAGNAAQDVAHADLDGDGRTDLVVTNYSDNTISVLRNTSTSGSLSFAPKTDLAAGDTPNFVSVGDIDSDGKIDLAVANAVTETISVYRNNSTPGTIILAPNVDFPVQGSFAVALGDVSGDGKIDLIVPDFGTNVFVGQNTSTGPGNLNFSTPQGFTAGSTVQFAAVSDFDRDGKADIAVVNQSSQSISVLRNVASALPPPTISGFSPTSGPVGTTVAITGTNFDPTPSNNTVKINGIAATVTSATATNLQVIVPAGATTGLINVTVDCNSVTSAVNFTLTTPPTITSITPSSGNVGSSVIITGTNFGSVAADNIVYFGATLAAVTAASPTQLTATVPDGSTYQPLSVTVNGLTAYAPSPFVATFPGTGVIDASSFAPKVDFGTSTRPTEVIIGDLDGDGKGDVATINDSSPTLSVLRSTSTPGTISFAARVDLPAGGSSQGMEVGDIDSDGKLDLITVSDGASQVSVHRNTSTPGTISFPPRVSFATGTTPVSVAIGDLDGDGKIDLAVSNASSNSVSVYHNTGSTGTISFAPRINFATGSNPYDVAVADIDLDTKPDLIVASRGTHIVSVFRNTSTPGSIAFAARVDIAIGAATQPYGVAVGDLDGDGKPDIASANSTARTVAVIRNISTPGTITTGSFDPPVSFATSASDPTYVSFGDVNGDGKPDLLVGNNNGTIIQVLRNTSVPGTFTAGSFSASVSYTTGTRPYTVKSGDIDGDGKPELAVANATSNTVSILRSQTVSCVPAAQRNALIALYNATDGANWNDNSGWLSADESTWVGVTLTGCDVTDISLPGNNLIGSLPAEIGDLPMLEGLDLGANQLSGSIPPEIGNLTNLVALNLAINQFDSFLPPELGNLASLEVLNLSFNMLNGTPPIELENLTSLTAAALNNNQFSGQPPLIGGSSVGMSTLELQFNSFNSLPDFTAYASISLINVANNRLTFDDLEPFIGLPNFFYDPQAFVPPGGIVAFIPGGTLNIPFSTGGTANSYQWYKDNVAIPGATSPSYSLPGATAAAVGFYHVRITSAVVPFLELRSETYTVITDPCASTTPTSGDLDTGFAPLIDVPSTFNQVEVQSTGKIITESGGTLINSVSRQGLLRFLPDGTLDNTFAANINTSPFLVQPNDQILASYYGGGYAYLVRMDANGNEDAAFTANVPQYYSGYVSAVALQSDNKILVAGNEYMSQPFIQRLNPDGTADGYLPDATGLDVSVIRIQTDGYILVGGQFIGGIARLDPTGVLDPSFLADIDDFVSDIAIQSDGRILVGGQFRFVNDIPKRALVRLLPDGSIDNSFSALGITNLTESGFNIRKIALQTDGKIVLAGEFESINGADRKNLVRLNSDGTVDCLFDAGVSTDLPIVGLALPSDSQILISGSFGDYDGTQRYGLARVNSGGGTGISITLQPSDAIVCEGATAAFSTAATGTTNITYQWQFSPDGIVPFADIADGGGYSGTATANLSVNTTGGFGEGRYQCRINGDLAAEVFTNDEGLFINPLPSPPGTSGAALCGSGSLTLTASGTTNGNYRWYTLSTGGTAISGEVNDTYVTPSLTGTTTYFVSIHDGTCESGTRTPVTATINSLPGAPGATGASSCTAAALTLSATGGAPGEYRWYATATGGTAIAGETNDTYLTPILTVTTTFHVALNDGTCESSRTPVTATIENVAKPSVVTSNCNAAGATLSGPAGFASYAWSNGGTSQAINVTVAGTYTLVVTSSGGCTSPVSDPVTFTAAFCNQPPVLQPTTVTTTVQGTATINLTSLTSDLDNNVDLTTLQIITQPSSGAVAAINASFELVVDYTDVDFVGTDQVTLQVCDVAGACVQEVITIEVAGDITVFNALSPNGDGLNDVFFIQYIDALPETQQNKVTIFNRWGTVVFETTNYDNSNNVFRGLSNSGAELPSGTYYYTIEFTSGAEKRTGFISLRR